ncbi:MAG: prepilin-type N-terminal cleavage/methylation domain-containing protein, partial [Gemmatimonadaceae bacterium]|nr:prepilin-type N-terminal cleavage/methylation domain-containing protein [Gemmatimonadaceae bacterium]
RARGGFTLLEVMIALLIGGVVVLLGYSTLGAGLDVEARVTAARELDASTIAFRATLTDALRHAVTGDGLQTGTDATGVTTRMSFVSRGVMQPLGGSEAWMMELASDSTGVTLDARPAGMTRAALHLSAHGPRTFAVRFLPLDDTAWRGAWNDPTRLPSAIEIRFLDAAGRDVGAALVARTSPVGGS